MISYDIFLLLNSDNKFAEESIKSLKEAKINSNINKYISTTEYYSKDLLVRKDLKNIKIIVHKNKYRSTWDHMIWLTNYSKADYLSFIHDDDFFSDNFFLNTYKNLEKYLPSAFSTRANYVNEDSLIFKYRQFKSLNKINLIKSIEVLQRCFLPFDRPISLPTIAFRKKELENYWFKYRIRNLSIFEDVRIIYFFSKYGLFMESQNANLYSYRIHRFQSSSIRKQIPRLRLIIWLNSLNIKITKKLILMLFAKIQFIIFYKENYFYSKKITKFMLSFRKNLIKYRTGE